MSQIVRLIVPSAPAAVAPALVAYRRRDAQGLRLGILDNSKSNANHLLRFVAEALCAALPIASLVSLQKPRAATKAPDEILNQLAKEADCVISGSGD